MDVLKKREERVLGVKGETDVPTAAAAVLVATRGRSLVNRERSSSGAAMVSSRRQTRAIYARKETARATNKPCNGRVKAIAG